MRYVGDMIRCDTEFCYDECSLGERQAGALKRIPQGYEKKCLSERGWSFWKTPAGVVRLGGSPGGSPTCGCSDPTTIRGFVQRGDYYKNKGRDEDALSDYRRAVEVDARSPDDFFHKGKVYEGLGRSWEALRAYRLFLEEAGDYSANYGPLIEQARERVGELEK
jgi:tetratricopeptide (TPR) repeat protein